jgi:hypothetical protein
MEERRNQASMPTEPCPDVPDSCGLQAFSRVEAERFSVARQGLVNHVSQALVNHAVNVWRVTPD